MRYYYALIFILFISFSTIRAELEPEFEKIHFAPETYRLEAVDAGYGRIVAGGYLGAVKLIYPGLETIHTVKTPSDETVVSAEILDERRFLFGAENGEIVYTHDGGYNWRAKKLENSGAFSDIESIGNFCAATHTDGHVYMSDDAGESWSSDGGVWGAAFEGVALKSESEIYVCSSDDIFLYSEDGGENFNLVEIEDRDFKFIRLYDDVLYMYGNSWTIAKSADFGRNWEYIEIENPPDGLNDPQIKYFDILEDGSFSLIIQDAMFLELWSFLVEPDGKYHEYKRHSGGDETYLRAFSKFEDGNIYGVGVNSSVGILSYDDSDMLLLTDIQLNVPYNFRKIATYDGERFFGLSGGNDLFYSPNFARDWAPLEYEPKSKPETRSLNIEDIAVERDLWVVVGTFDSLMYDDGQIKYDRLGFIMRSENAGEKWNDYLNPNRRRITKIDFAGEYYAVLDGFADTMLVSYDKVKNWSDLYLPSEFTYVDLLSAPVPGAVYVYAYDSVEEKKKLLKTINGGAEWIDVDDPDNDFEILRMIAENFGYAVYSTATKNVVARTTDGGARWRVIEQNQLGDRTARNLEFWNDEIGAVTLTDGTVMYTDNGGQSWLEFIPDERDKSGYFDLCFAGPRRFYLVSSRGYLIDVNLIEVGVIDKISESINIFPNPTSDVLSVSGNDEVILSLSVSDFFGKEMKKLENSAQIDVSDLSTGTYFLEIETPEGRIFKKFVKI